jgi:asparagine synthase (glutamine-hydrolysing)
MRVAALISGGKDSIYAAYKASEKHEIVCLISFKSKRDDSYMFHIPNTELVKLQAKSMGIPLIFSESCGIKEEELADIRKALREAIKKYNIEGVVSGALASNYQKERIDTICRELKLKSIAPLWHIKAEGYLKEMIKNNFKVIITGIAADGLTKEFLGKEIDEDFLERVRKMRIHVGGEGGEYESLVLDCPLFRQRLRIKKAEIIMEGECAGKYVVEAELVAK